MVPKPIICWHSELWIVFSLEALWIQRNFRLSQRGPHFSIISLQQWLLNNFQSKATILPHDTCCFFCCCVPVMLLTSQVTYPKEWKKSKSPLHAFLACGLTQVMEKQNKPSSWPKTVLIFLWVRILLSWPLLPLGLAS